MKVFITGLSGFIGGSVTHKLVEAGHNVVGLVRSENEIENIKNTGVAPLLGTLADTDLLVQAAQEANAIINAADADNATVTELFIKTLEGSNKIFIQTSGSSIVGDKASGKPSDKIYDEESLTNFQPVPEKAARFAIDRRVLAASKNGVHSIVICPSMIYGQGLGIKKDSIQVPLLVKQTQKSGIPRYVGDGLNIWSNVHIEDVAELYLLAVEKSPAGQFYFAENGEASLKSIVEKIGEKLHLAEKVASWTVEQAVAEWGFEPAVFALGSNSRVRGTNARKKLNWKPKYSNIFESIVC